MRDCPYKNEYFEIKSPNPNIKNSKNLVSAKIKRIVCYKTYFNICFIYNENAY